MSETILEARDVRQTYRIRGGWGRKARVLQAVRDVSLSVERGSVLGIVGESGCGKSTLARLMLGLERPSAGSILLNGTDVATLGRRAIARRLQPIFQDPYASLNPRRTILGSVEAPLAVHGLGNAAERRRKAMDMMDRVGLPARFAERYPAELSGGQRQRVAIARALALEPEIVICDEPTSALDVSVQAQILNLLADLRRDLGLTYVLISHNLGVIEHMASRVAVMYLGEVVEESATADLFAAPRHPYTQALLASVLTPVPGLGLPDTGLGLTPPDPTALDAGCAFAPRCRQVMTICRTTAPALAPIAGSETRVACHLHETGYKSAAA